MRISVIGAGPAGLYAAILIKRYRPDIDVIVTEQNPAGSTWGFGVVFSDEALTFLQAGDPETARLIEPQLKRWSDIILKHRGESITIDGIGFAGIGRLDLLKLLQHRATDLGAIINFDHRIGSIDEVDGDLVIGCDGLNSVVRASGDFGETIEYLGNRFAWFGTEREFDALTQTFVETSYGPMNAHHYTYAPNRSTFIIEMPEDVFAHTQFGACSEARYRTECEQLFSTCLDGARLIANNSVWRNFPNLTCSNWHVGNRVLVGDALHTAHFSIGSGTRLALEDVTALVKALCDSEWVLATALPMYQTARQPVLTKLIRAARASGEWYEDFACHMALEPLEFALSYIRRSGRMRGERLRQLAPQFMCQVEAHGIEFDD